MVLGTDGNFYGTTSYGGAGSCADGNGTGCGTVFKITPRGTLTTLHSFNITDGSHPFAGLVQAVDGNLYGTTTSDGAYGYGTIFRISSSGTLTTIHNFCDTSGCSYDPGPLVQTTDGSFYGTMTYGGSEQYGTIFKTTSSGLLTMLDSFDSRANIASHPNTTPHDKRLRTPRLR